MLKRVSRVLGMGAGSALLGVLAFSVAYSVQSQTMPGRAQSQAQSQSPPPFTFQPYLAHTTTTRYKGDGTYGSTTQETFGRRTDGSTVHMFAATAPNGDRYQVVEFYDLRSQRDVLLEPLTRSATTIYFNGKQVESKRRRESTECVAMLGDRGDAGVKIMGMAATRIREDSGKFKFQIDSLVSPELGCLVLKETAIHPRGARNEVEITQLSLVEPPDALFQVPIEYVERSPAEKERLWRERFPGHQFYGDALVKVAQKRYEDSRK